MLLAIHVMAGATTSLLIGNAGVSAPVCFATHAILDALPHWSFPIPKQHTLRGFLQSFGPDLVLSVVLFVVLIGLYADQWFLVSWGVGWAVLPDWLTLFRNRRPWKRILRRFYAFHNQIQWEVSVWPGLAVEAIVGFILVVALKSQF